MMSATGRAIRYVKKVENGQMRVRPVPVVKDRIIGALLISALRSQIQTAITSAISSLITNALGRSLVPANKVSKVALRQIFNGGLLGQLTAPATDAAASSGTNIMEEMAMNMAQQQIEQMLSSGQFEEIVQDFMADPETEQMINDMMAEVMRPPTEEEAAMMMSMMEELMKPPTEEEMPEMEQAWMDWESQMEEEWKANGGLMGMMDWEAQMEE